MKKKALALVVILTMVFAAGCGSKGTKDSGASESNASVKDFNADDLAKDLLSKITYSGEMKQMSDDDIAFLIEPPEGVKAVVYKGDKANTTEIVGIFTAPDKNVAGNVRTAVDVYLADLKDEAEKYSPEDTKRLQGALLVVKDQYVVVSVSDSPDEAKKIIDSALK